MLINDGRTGVTVEVGSDNHARVQAKTHTKEHVASLNDGDGYVIHTGTTSNMLLSTITGGPILYLTNNNPSNVIVVTDVLTFTDGVAASTLIFRLIRNPVLGTVGNNNVFTPVNLNFGSSKVADATVHSWDGVGNGITGITGGSLLMLLPINPNGVVRNKFDNMIVIPQGGSIALEAIGASNILASMSFYFHPNV